MTHYRDKANEIAISGHPSYNRDIPVKLIIVMINNFQIVSLSTDILCLNEMIIYANQFLEISRSNNKSWTSSIRLIVQLYLIKWNQKF